MAGSNVSKKLLHLQYVSALLATQTDASTPQA